MISQISSSIGPVSPAVTQPVGGNSGGDVKQSPAVNVSPSSVDVQLPTQAVKSTEKVVDVNKLKNAADQINKVLQQMDRNLQFTVDADTGTQVVKVIDTVSKEVIRQMPTPDMLAIAKALDKLQGLLLKEKA